MKDRNPDDEMSWLGDDDALEEVTNLAGTIVGAAVGLAAGPIGVVAGAVVGSAMGSLAGMAMDRSGRAHDAIDTVLDEEIGVYDGELGRGEAATIPAPAPPMDVAAWSDLLDEPAEVSDPFAEPPRHTPPRRNAA